MLRKGTLSPSKASQMSLDKYNISPKQSPVKGRLQSMRSMKVIHLDIDHGDVSAKIERKIDEIFSPAKTLRTSRSKGILNMNRSLLGKSAKKLTLIHENKNDTLNSETSKESLSLEDDSESDFERAGNLVINGSKVIQAQD